MDVNKAIENLRRKGFKVTYFETGAEAAEYICQGCAGHSVGIGGMKTALDIGLIEKLHKVSEVYSLSAGRTPEGYKKAAEADIYLTSANAISETGEIINIDGFGNRVSSTLFGHEKVYIVAGVNKLEPDIPSAMHRARNIAAPLNARRLGKNTPCAKSDELKCYDCSSPERICRAFVITERPMRGADNEVVLINESLGF